MKFLFILSAVIIVTLNSCNFYRPSMLNAPVLEKKGEAVVGAAIVNEFNISGAYAITDRFSIAGNAAFHGGEFSSGDFGNGQETVYANSQEYDCLLYTSPSPRD